MADFATVENQIPYTHHTPGEDQGSPNDQQNETKHFVGGVVGKRGKKKNLMEASGDHSSIYDINNTDKDWPYSRNI